MEVSQDLEIARGGQALPAERLETRRKLVEDMTFWLTEPASPASIALTITVSEEKNRNHPSTKTVVIEK